MSKVMGIYVKFTKTIHQIWSYHVTLASNSENFYFLHNSEKLPDLGEIGSRTKSYRQKNKLRVENTPSVLIGLTFTYENKLSIWGISIKVQVHLQKLLIN